MRDAGMRGSALRISARGLLVASLVLSCGAQPPDRALHRDLLVATPSTSQPGAFEIRLWASSGALGTFVPRQFVVGGAGSVTHLDRNDFAGGDYFAAADLPPAGLAGSVIYSFVSPFTRTMRMNHDPLRTHYGVSAPERITDFEYDPPNAADPIRSDSFVVVGVDAATGANWVRRVPLSGAPVTGLVFGGGAQRLTLAIDPAGGDIHVVDDRGLLYSFDARLTLLTFNQLTPAVACRDLVWQEAPLRSGRLLVSGYSASVARDAIFEIAPGAAPTATPMSFAPAGVRSIVIDGAADGYCLLDASGGGAEVWHWENNAGALHRTNLPVAGYQAIAWSSRCTVEMIAASPGTPVRASLVPPRVGDAGLTFSVTAPAGVTMEPVGILFSSRWTDLGIALGPRARLIVDPAATGFVFVPLLGAHPPTVVVSQPLVAAYDGVRIVAQMVWQDVGTKEWLTSWAANFVIGQ